MLDQIDRQLIEHLQNNSRISISELSRIVNLSRPSVNERITRLMEKGILKKFTTYVPPAAVGRKVSFFIQVDNLKVSFEKFSGILLSKECVTEIYAVTGHLNYIIKASTKDIEEMNALLSELMPYGRIVTSVILNAPLVHRPIKPIED